MKAIIKKAHFYLIKLPLIYIAIPTGLIFEFLITVPYIVLCTLDGISRQRKVDHMENNRGPDGDDKI